MHRKFLAALMALGWLCGFTKAASAQGAETNWPTRPITMVVAYPPGAITDTVGRRVAERLSQALNVQVVVENRGGAGGNVAAAFVSRAQPDGYTLLFTSYGNLIIAAAADLNVGFHPWRDLAPVGMIGPMTVVLLVRPGLQVNSLQDFVRHITANPGRVNFASVGVGSSYHLLIEQMIAYGKLNMTHVPYRGGAAAMTDFLAGRVDATLATLLFARPYMQDNRGIGVAVGNAERSPVLPNVPAVQEVIPGAKLTDGLAVLAPAATPAAIIARANRALQDVINQPAMREWLTNEGVPPRPGPPEAFMAEMTPATEELRKLLRDAAIKVE